CRSLGIHGRRDDPQRARLRNRAQADRRRRARRQRSVHVRVVGRSGDSQGKAARQGRYAALTDQRIVESAVPARLDALRWSRFHTLVIVALGITWVLDGLEVTLAGAVSGALKASPTLHFEDAQVG